MALKALQVLQDDGMEIPEPLIKALVESSIGDEEAERILSDLIKME